MTITKTEFNELRDTILKAAEQQGVSKKELYENYDQWHMDYKDNLDRYFKYMIKKFNEDIKLFKQAIERNDKITASVALVHIYTQSRSLADFYQEIYDDIVYLLWGEGLRDKWPEIPENFQIPLDYDYENTNLSYDERNKDIAAFNAEEDRLDELEQRPKPKVLTLRKKTSSD